MRNVLNTTFTAIDHDQLLNRVLGNSELASRLLDKFMEAAPRECDVMETAARLGDVRLLASTAHRHKGTAATMAASGIARVAAELERSADSGDAIQWLELIEQLRLLHAEVRQTLSPAASGHTRSSRQGERQ